MFVLLGFVWFVAALAKQADLRFVCGDGNMRHHVLNAFSSVRFHAHAMRVSVSDQFETPYSNTLL
jgi:hypothetical protein